MKLKIKKNRKHKLQEHEVEIIYNYIEEKLFQQRIKEIKIRKQKNNIIEKLKNNIIEHQENDLIQKQKNDIILKQKNNIIEKQKNNIIEKQKNNIIEHQENDIIEKQTINFENVSCYNNKQVTFNLNNNSTLHIQNNEMIVKPKAKANLNILNLNKNEINLINNNLCKSDEYKSIKNVNNTNYSEVLNHSKSLQHVNIEEKLDKLFSEGFTYEKLTKNFCNLKLTEKEMNQFIFHTDLKGNYKVFDYKYHYNFII